MSENAREKNGHDDRSESNAQLENFSSCGMNSNNISAKNILDNDEFLSLVCTEVMRRYKLIDGGCLNVLFYGWDPQRVTSVIKRMLIHMCAYAFQERKNATNVRLQKANLNRLYCTTQIESMRVDFYEVRKAHLRYMSQSGRVIGLQEIRNLADLLCKVLLENDVHPSDVCLLRHSLFVMNIMQISGYFKVDQVRWEQEGIASEFDGEFCKKMIAERGEFIKIEEVPKSASEISELNEERKRRSHEKEEETKWNMRMRDWNGQDTVTTDLPQQ